MVSLERHNHTPIADHIAGSVEGCLDLSRMMCVVVIDEYAIDLATELKSAPGSRESL